MCRNCDGYKTMCFYWIPTSDKDLECMFNKKSLKDLPISQALKGGVENDKKIL